VISCWGSLQEFLPSVIRKIPHRQNEMVQEDWVKRPFSYPADWMFSQNLMEETASGVGPLDCRQFCVGQSLK
jgi:hypothetical protein